MIHKSFSRLTDRKRTYASSCTTFGNFDAEAHVVIAGRQTSTTFFPLYFIIVHGRHGTLFPLIIINSILGSDESRPRWRWNIGVCYDVTYRQSYKVNCEYIQSISFHHFSYLLLFAFASTHHLIFEISHSQNVSTIRNAIAV